MFKKHIKEINLILAFLCLSLLYYNTFIYAQDTIADRVSGKILLQVEENGEAWYVYPPTKERHYMGKPEDAFSLMENLGLGISNSDLEMIPINKSSFGGNDSDGDGLSDKLENSIGSDPNKSDTDGDGYDDKTEIENGFKPIGDSRLAIDNEFAKSYAGYIMIQAEQNGEAWYINPSDNQRYLLGRPQDAFNIMRKTGLGISNLDLSFVNKFDPSPSHTTENTEIASETKRRYSKNGLSFTYPIEWLLSMTNGAQQNPFLRNYQTELLEEKKASITVAHIKSEELIDLELFKVTSKPGATKTVTDLDLVNTRATLSETFYYKDIDAQETTHFMQTDDKEMVVVTLFSAGNHNYHESTARDILESVELY